MKIGFLSEFSPADRKASSGTNFKMAEQLGHLGDVEWIPIRKTWIGKGLARISDILHKAGLPNLSLHRLRPLYKLAYKPIKESAFEQYDLLCAFFCVQTLAQLNTPVPVIYFSDSTFPVLLNYYYAYSDIPKALQNHIKRTEQIALGKTYCSVFCSEWARQGALSLDIAFKNTEVVELGANIDDSDINSEVTGDSEDSENGGDRKELKLLFSGVDWVRKGGDIAVAAVDWLNHNDIPAKLHLVGVNPPEHVKANPYVICHGFKNKNNPEEYRELVELNKTCDILLLPTVAECAGIVFSEASAYGLPILTHDTGGIPNYVRNGVNGYRLPLGSTGDDFGRKIKQMIVRGELAGLSEGGKKLYRETLNWTRWRLELERIIDKVLKRDKPSFK